MKQSYKVLLINIGIAVLLTIISMAMYGNGMQAADVGIAFGLVCLGLGLLDLFIGLILALRPEHRVIGRALLLSGAVLLLLSGISCSTALSNARF